MMLPSKILNWKNFKIEIYLNKWRFLKCFNSGLTGTLPPTRTLIVSAFNESVLFLMPAQDFSTVRSLNEEDKKPYTKPIKYRSHFYWYVIYSLQTKMGILGLAPLHSQKHGYGPGRQRRLARSRTAKQRRGVGGGCVELGV